MFAHLLFNAFGAGFVGLALVRLAPRPRLGGMIVASVILGALSLPLALLLASRAHPGARMFATMAHGTCTVFLHYPALGLACACAWRESSRWRALTALSMALLLLGIGANAFFYEPFDLQVARHELASEKLSRPIRLVVLADLQTGDFGDYERGALELALEQEPDLLLLPGDYIQAVEHARWGQSAPRLVAALAELDFGAPLGALAVGGNVDPPGWPQLFLGSRVQAFVDTTRVEVDELIVTALSLSDGFDDGLVLEAEERFHIVLSHGPDAVLSGELRADLFVAGHCHGGQVRLPLFGPLVKLSSIPREWTDGLHEMRSGEWLCVSRGVGVERGWAPPVRFLCKPEIVVIDLVPADENG